MAQEYIGTDHFFFAKKKQRYQRINIHELIYVSASRSSIELFTEAGRQVVSANLSSFCRQIQHPLLMRVHRSYVVNLSKIEAFEETRLIMLKHKHQIEIPIGKTYRDALFGRLFRLRSD